MKEEDEGDLSLNENVGQISSDEQDITEIKGDAIGNTLYSERWVLKTLIKLSQYNEDVWNSDYEQEICLLWDMTVENDVILFLHQHNFYSIFFNFVQANSGNNRLLEIMVGILGNMCTSDIIRKSLSEKEELCVTLIKMLSLEDSLTLVQLIRLLNTCLWTAQVAKDDDSSNIKEDGRTENESNETGRSTGSWMQIVSSSLDYILHQIKFFLFSSANEELLCITLEFLQILLRIPDLGVREEVAKSPEAVAGLTESLKQLLKTLKPGDSIIENRRLWRGCAVWNDVASEIASIEEGLLNLEFASNNLFKCLIRLIRILTDSPNMRTRDSEVVSEYLCIVEALDSISLDPYVVTEFISVLYVAHRETAIKKAEKSEEAEVLNELTERIKILFQRVLATFEDLNSIFEKLKDFELDFVCGVVDDRETLKSKVNRAMLNIKTNGLI